MTHLRPSAVVSRALSICWENRRELLSLLGPWIALTLAIGLAGVVFFPDFAGLMRGGKAGLHHISGGRLAVLALICVAFLISTASFAVNWHRHLLLRETELAAFRFDGAVWRYAGTALLILAFPVLLAGAAMGLTAGSAVQLGPAAPLAVVTIFIAAFVAMARLSIKLPAVAIAQNDFGLQAAWRASAGNGIRMLLTLVFLSLITGAVSSCASIASALVIATIGGASLMATLLITAVQILIIWLPLLLDVTVINVFYNVLVEGREI